MDERMARGALAAAAITGMLLFLLKPDLPNMLLATDLFPAALGKLISAALVFSFGLLLAVALFSHRIRIRTRFPDVPRLSAFNAALVLFAAAFLFLFALSLAVPPNFQAHDGAHYAGIGYNIYSGRGFATNTLWAVMLRPAALPFADTYRAPLVPYLLAGFYRFFGPSFATEKLLFVLTGALIPALALLFVYMLTSSFRIAALAAALVFFDWNLVLQTRIIHAELPFAAASLLFFYAVCTFKNRPRDYALAGASFALAYLARYQALVLFPPLLLIAFRRCGIRESLRRTLIVGALFLLVASPWLLRNMSLTGNPFHSDLGSITAAEAFSVRGPDYDIYALDTVPRTIFSVALAEPLRFISHAAENLMALVRATPFLVYPNPVFAVLGIIGFVHHRRFMKTKDAELLAAYVLISYLFFSLTYAQARFLIPLIPFLLVFSAMGAAYLARRASGLVWTSRRLAQHVLIVLVIAGIAVNLAIIAFGFSDLGEKGRSSKETYRLVKDFFPRNATVMVDSFPYFYEYYSRGNLTVVQFPYYDREDDLQKYMRQYHVGYVVLHKDGISAEKHRLPDAIAEKVYENGARIVYRVIS